MKSDGLCFFRCHHSAFCIGAALLFLPLGVAKQNRGEKLLIHRKRSPFPKGEGMEVPELAGETVLNEVKLIRW